MIKRSRLDGKQQVSSLRMTKGMSRAWGARSKIDDLTQAKLKELLSGMDLALVKALERRLINDQKLWENAYNACYEERLVVEKPKVNIERERETGAY